MSMRFSSTPPENRPERARETLFWIDDRACTIPVTFTPIEMARYAHTVQEFGADAAGVFALRLALGEETYLAYLNLPDGAVSDDDFARIMALITGRLVGLDVQLPKEPDPVPVPEPEVTWPGPDVSADRTHSAHAD